MFQAFNVQLNKLNIKFDKLIYLVQKLKNLGLKLMYNRLVNKFSFKDENFFFC